MRGDATLRAWTQEPGTDGDVERKRDYREPLVRGVGAGARVLLPYTPRAGLLVGEWETNPTMEAEYIMLTHFMG